MATGNFTHRLRQSQTGDSLSALTWDLNHIAETLQQTIIAEGYVIPKYTFQNTVQLSIILDQKFIIKHLSNNCEQVLGYNPKQILNCPISDILSNCQTEFPQILSFSKDKPSFPVEILLLQFKTAEGTILPLNCSISRLFPCCNIIISSLSTLLQDHIPSQVTSAGVDRSNTSVVIQKLHDYILSHLDEPLPNLKQLSKMFGVNEFKLKDGFRFFFNTSIHHFYNEERLKKAHLLIQHSSHSIKAVAFMCGFNDYVTFYKAFRKKYGYAPGELYRSHGHNA